MINEKFSAKCERYKVSLETYIDFSFQAESRKAKDQSQDLI